VDSVQTSAARIIAAERDNAHATSSKAGGIDLAAAREPPLTQAQLAAHLLHLSSALASRDLAAAVTTLQLLLSAPASASGGTAPQVPLDTVAAFLKRAGVWEEASGLQSGLGAFGGMPENSSDTAARSPPSIRG